MTLLEAARALDARDKPAESAWAYEMALRAERFTVDDYLDLVGVYFQVLDFGYASHHHLTVEFESAASVRLPQVLEEAARVHGPLPEIEFWSEFWRYICLGDPEPQPEKYRLSAQEGGDSVMYLFAFRGISELEPMAREVMQRSSVGLTNRQRYVHSVLQAALAEPPRHPPHVTKA